MAELTVYAASPFAFIFRYVRLRPISHAAILIAVLAAVGCAVCTQYGVKFLVDTLSSGENAAAWTAFSLLGALIAADNLLWRVAAWIANYAFVGVTGDLRRDLFSHLMGHSPSYFSERLPGMLTSRVTATSNAMFTAENMFMWNVLPPCVATVAAIALVLTISVPMAATLAVIAGIMVYVMFRFAAAGRPLHYDFARKAAAVDGEMIDVVSNMSLVRAFGGFLREHRRFDATVNREMTARRRSLFYLEKLLIFHAIVTILLTLGLVAWAIMLWQRGQATTGDVVLACTLALSVLNATRDLAVALVDITQHIARLSEAVATLLVPHELRDDPQAAPLVRRGASVKFERVDFISVPVTNLERSTRWYRDRLGLEQIDDRGFPEFQLGENVSLYLIDMDAIGSEFGSRHTQYEMFYAGARFVTAGHSLRTFDWDGATGMVESLLASYDLADEIELSPS